MAKRFGWNEALAAYDRDLDVIEATRNDYIEFLTQTLDDVTKRVKQLSGGAIELDVWSEDRLDAQVERIAEWKPQGVRELGGLGVQVFPSAAMGGPPGSLLVELWLDTSAAVPREIGALEVCDTLLKAVVDLAGAPHDPVKHYTHFDPEFVHLRVVDVELEAKDLVERLAGHVLAYCDAAKRLTDTIALLPRADDPYHWARVRLLEVRTTWKDEWTPKSAPLIWDPKERKLDAWEDGRYLGVKKRKDGEDDDLWVCAMPEGEVVFAAHGPVTSDKPRWKALCSLAKGRTRKFDDGPGATLLDAAAMKTMAEAGKTREFRELVIALFRSFLGG